jgi:hypothetical protein
MTRADDVDPNADVDPEDDAGEDLEAMIEQADHAFGAESFGTTAEEELRGESLDERLSEERPDRPRSDSELAIEDADAPDDEAQLVAEATTEREAYVAPEEAALTVRDTAPGGVDHAGDEYVELFDETMGTSGDSA